MGRSEKCGRREQFCPGFKRIVVLFAQEHGRKWAAFPLFAADLVKSDRLLDAPAPMSRRATFATIVMGAAAVGNEPNGLMTCRTFRPPPSASAAGALSQPQSVVFSGSGPAPKSCCHSASEMMFPARHGTHRSVNRRRSAQPVGGPTSRRRRSRGIRRSLSSSMTISVPAARLTQACSVKSTRYANDRGKTPGCQ